MRSRRRAASQFHIPFIPTVSPRLSLPCRGLDVLLFYALVCPHPTRRPLRSCRPQTHVGYRCLIANAARLHKHSQAEARGAQLPIPTGQDQPQALLA